MIGFVRSVASSTAPPTTSDASWSVSPPERRFDGVAAVRAFALSLPRTTEGLVAVGVRFRVGRLVYAALSPDAAGGSAGARRRGRATSCPPQSG